jgi:hypothetical protein
LHNNFYKNNDKLKLEAASSTLKEAKSYFESYQQITVSEIKARSHMIQELKQILHQQEILTAGILKII